VSHPQADDYSESSSPREQDDVPDKELNRRLKISAANKGRVPWNKGREHPEAVRAKIRQRTFEAMQRPDVRARMAHANQRRPPHRDDVKDKIRTVLRQRAAEARVVIVEQAGLVVASMLESDDEAEREAAQQSDAQEIVSRLAWRYLKRDFHTTYDQWAANTGDFRNIVTTRIQELAERKRVRAKRGEKGRPRKAPAGKSPAGKLRAAVATQKKLELARSKVAQAEAVIKKMEEVRASVAEHNNPQAMQMVAVKEAHAREVLEKLKEQVQALTEALAPLQQYLAPSTSSIDFVTHQQAQHAQHHALEEAEKAEERSVSDSDAPLPVNGAVPLVNGNGNGNGALNGAAPLAAAGTPGASTSRLPWRQ